MKKRILLTLFIGCFAFGTYAQNFQFLYGYGNQKPVNFITAEVFKPLDRGPLYYFTDFKIDVDGYSESYTEISKYWIISRSNVSLTAQYNAGVSSDGNNAIRIVPAYLFGLQKAVNINDWILSLDVLYRIDKSTNVDGAQLTFQYAKSWGNFSLSGYCDLWNSGKFDPNKSATAILFEPQLGYLISKRVSVILEGRLSNYNVLVPYDNYCMVGLKWNLEN